MKEPANRSHPISLEVSLLELLWDSFLILLMQQLSTDHRFLNSSRLFLRVTVQLVIKSSRLFLRVTVQPVMGSLRSELFCRISFLLYVSFAKETYNFIDPTDRSHPLLTLCDSCLTPRSHLLYLRSHFFNSLLAWNPAHKKNLFLTRKNPPFNHTSHNRQHNIFAIRF